MRTGELDVTGIDPWELLAALHNASRVSPTSACWNEANRAPSRTINAAQAKEEAQDGLRDGPVVLNKDRYRYVSFRGGAPQWPDYLFGRPINVHLVCKDGRVFLVGPHRYDQDVGEGAAKKVVDSLA